MRESIINDNDRVLRFDLPIESGSADLVAHCEINPETSKEEFDAKAKRVHEWVESCATESVKLFIEICEFANDPGDVSGLALAYASACVRLANDIHKRYLHAFGEAVEKKRAKREAGESESEAGAAAKKD